MSIHCILDHDARTVLVQVSTAELRRSILPMETCTSGMETCTCSMERSTCSMESRTRGVHRSVSTIEASASLHGR
ncbi:MAG TPA: hypothetical protein DCY47_03855 [Candidatus Accumulibacter sp.]|nr:hypothetical protein [Accumulibacter sp.]